MLEGDTSTVNLIRIGHTKKMVRACGNLTHHNNISWQIMNNSVREMTEVVIDGVQGMSFLRLVFILNIRQFRNTI